jgi:hypothetical protein
LEFDFRQFGNNICDFDHTALVIGSHGILSNVKALLDFKKPPVFVFVF